MICKWKFFLGLIVLSSSTYSWADNQPFHSNEHLDIGDKVLLYLSPNHPPQNKIHLHLANGLSLSYGELIALGDFYGDPDNPISQGYNNSDIKTRFLSAFNQFAQANGNNTQEVNDIVNTIHNEQNSVELGLERGLSEEETYREIGDKYQRQYNCLTGGGCSESTWWFSFGRYIKLANANYDHFGENALITYRIGHALAIQKAIQASKTANLKQLEIAYAINAFACHFLSDRYASGHIRTPRNELSKNISPRIVGTLLARFMHDEDNLYGVHVHNKLGEQWIAVGDKSYFSPRALTHQIQQLKALQVSADEVFTAYEQGFAPEKDEVEDYIPYPDEVGPNTNLDLASLFYWDDLTQKLMRRSSLNNRYAGQWTSSWWSWLTLVKLLNGKPMPIPDQISLAQSFLADDAVKEGLIDDPRIIAKFHLLKI